MAALRLYVAREAIEAIDDALIRIDHGGYGTCLSCDQPIPFNRLAAVPQARFCAVCPAPASPTAGRTAGPRLGSSRDDRAGRPHPVRARDTASVRGASPTPEMARGNSFTE
jgi:hypothetical protein